MREPGASDVLMCLRTVSPRSTAFFASRPAASSTLGLDVFVHDVIAAISTSPLPMDTCGSGGSRNTIRRRPVGDHLDDIARRGAVRHLQRGVADRAHAGGHQRRDDALGELGGRLGEAVLGHRLAEEARERCS